MGLNRFNKSDGHHPVQQAFGGSSEQELIYVLRRAHSALHSVQNLLMRENGLPPANWKGDWNVLFQNNPAAKKALIQSMLGAAGFVDRQCGYKGKYSFSSSLKRELRRHRLYGGF